MWWLSNLLFNRGPSRVHFLSFENINLLCTKNWGKKDLF